jgi:hypothetical protein
MKKGLIFIACILFYSCFKEPKKTEKLNSFETSQRIEKISESTELDNQDKENQKELKYSHIKTFEGNYPADENLFETGILKTQLLKLLGEENYNLFIQNMEVQVPIEIINDEYAFVSGGAPHNFGSEEACIEIDFVNSIISVGILSEDKGVLYFTEKEDKSLKRGKLYEWLSEVNKITMNKNIN